MLKFHSRYVRHIIFSLSVIAATAMLHEPLSCLFASNFHRDYHDLIPFIPIISLYLIYLKRKDISMKMQYSFIVGIALTLLGIVLYGLILSNFTDLNENDYATVSVFSVLIVIWGSFIFAYGLKAFQAALFALLFLVFVIPFPVAIMEEVIGFLQRGSTEFANLLFWMSGVSFTRDGFVFQLPNMSVEVAPQCSGIRSGLALLITALLAGHLFLKTWWKQLILVLCVIPMTMLKNGIRIATLTLLSVYVDPRIIQSPLHREGGIPFFIVALLLMAPILFFLRRSEKKDVTGDSGGSRSR